MDRNFENAPTHISSINICCADVSGVPAMVGNKRHRFAIRWLHYYNRCYCLLVRVHEGYFGLMKNLTSHAAACTCTLLLLAHAHCCCLHMRIAAASDLEKILASHLGNFFRLEKQLVSLKFFCLEFHGRSMPTMCSIPMCPYLIT